MLRKVEIKEEIFKYSFFTVPERSSSCLSVTAAEAKAQRTAPKSFIFQKLSKKRKKSKKVVFDRVAKLGMDCSNSSARFYVATDVLSNNSWACSTS